jgi:hypothetical protein
MDNQNNVGSSELTNPESWMPPTQTLNMNEMDNLVKLSQTQWDEYEAKRKEATALLEKYNKTEAAIMQALKDAGKKSYKVDGLGTISIRETEIVRVPATAEQKKKFFQYLRGKGESVLYSLASVNSNTLNAWYRKEAEEAQRAGVLGFSIPGVEGSTVRETMAFTADRKGKRE